MGHIDKIVKQLHEGKEHCAKWNSIGQKEGLAIVDKAPGKGSNCVNNKSQCQYTESDHKYPRRGVSGFGLYIHIGKA